MLTFAQTVFDGFVSGSGNVYTLTDVSELLGSTDYLQVSVSPLAIAGTSPTLTVQLEGSFDGTRWQNQSSTPEINGFGLGGGDNSTLFFVTTSSPIARPPRIRLRIALGGTTPSGLLRVHAAGRSTGTV